MTKRAGDFINRHETKVAPSKTPASEIFSSGPRILAGSIHSDASPAFCRMSPRSSSLDSSATLYVWSRPAKTTSVSPPVKMFPRASPVVAVVDAVIAATA